MEEELNRKVGLVIEYYNDPCQSERVQTIIREIQNLYDFNEETEENLKPLLEELYRHVVKREFHSELILELLKEMDKIQ